MAKSRQAKRGSQERGSAPQDAVSAAVARLRMLAEDVRAAENAGFGPFHAAATRFYEGAAALRSGRFEETARAGAVHGSPGDEEQAGAGGRLDRILPAGWRARRERKAASVMTRELMHRARHIRHMRQDVLPAALLQELCEGEAAAKASLASRDPVHMREAANALGELLERAHPSRFSDAFRRKLGNDVACSLALCAEVEKALRSRTPDEAATSRLELGLRAIRPYEPPAFSAWMAENLEVIVVAVAVAMAFRTYFIQPFKIPTGSMQPTLYGITSVAVDGPAWRDRAPLKILTWAVTGDWYDEVRIAPRLSDRFPLNLAKWALTRRMYRDAGAQAVIRGPYPGDDNDPSACHYFVGGNRFRVPKDAVLRGEVRIRDGQTVRRGELLWRGRWRAGDHVFVDRVRWNFARPKRGQIMVFNTTDIPGLPQGTHYIKRMVGLPNERISIDPPQVFADGQPIVEPDGIGRIARCEPPYGFGYTLAGEEHEGVLCRPTDSFLLGPDRYFALGDNTRNSRDSRYWGAVPRRNLVGPAVVVYWPFTRRWGRIY